MLNNTLKVYGEHLLDKDINVASATSDTVVRAGGTQGALCINVFATSAITLTEDMTITVTHGDSENGEFADLTTFSFDGGDSYSAGELIASSVLAQECKACVSAKITSGSGNTGHVLVTLGYLAR